MLDNGSRMAKNDSAFSTKNQHKQSAVSIQHSAFSTQHSAIQPFSIQP